MGKEEKTDDPKVREILSKMPTEKLKEFVDNAPIRIAKLKKEKPRGYTKVVKEIAMLRDAYKNELFKRHGLHLEVPQLNVDAVPLIKKLYAFVEQYKDNSAIIEWNGNAEGVAKALEEIKKQLQEDGLKHLIFVTKI